MRPPSGGLIQIDGVALLFWTSVHAPVDHDEGTKHCRSQAIGIKAPADRLGLRRILCSTTCDCRVGLGSSTESNPDRKKKKKKGAERGGKTEDVSVQNKGGGGPNTAPSRPKVSPSLTCRDGKRTEWAISATLMMVLVNHGPTEHSGFAIHSLRHQIMRYEGIAEVCIQVEASSGCI